MRITIAFLLLLASAFATPTSAGPYGDDLAKCLVKSSSDADRNMLVKWFFAGAALHPEIRDIATITEAQREALNRQAAALFERLLTQACKTELQEAVKYEGAVVFRSSFQVLGQVAGQGLFSHPAVNAGMQDFTKYLDMGKLAALMGTPPK
jgi:hypothetical protein